MTTDFQFPTLIGAGVYDSANYRRSGTTPARTVAFYELEISLTDGGQLNIDNESRRIESGLIVLAKPGQRRSTLLPYKCRYLHISPCESPICRELDRLSDFFAPERTEHLISLFESVTAEPIPHGFTIEPKGENLSRYAIFLSIIAELSELIHADPSAVEELPNGLNPAIAASISLIDTSPGRFVRLEELAAAAHLNPIYLHRLFTRELGMTPYRFILNRKLTLAKNLLISTDRSCQELALELGFSSPSAFSSVFRREFGITPSEFRIASASEIF